MRFALQLASIVVVPALAVFAVGCGDARGDNPDSGTASQTASATEAGSGEGQTATSGSDSGASADASGAPDTDGNPTSASASGTAGEEESGTSGGSSASGSDTGSTSEITGEASTGGDGSSGGEASTGTADDGVIEIGIRAINDCTFIVEPSSITVPEGTEFTVNWVSLPASEVEFDVAKIDPFNHVPIILGMEPGTSYHDDIREWCGPEFTGTFEFRLTSCFEPQYIPVDCGG